MKKIIDTDGAKGFIFAFPSGVVYSNQAGGCACDHPELEGVFVPWPFPDRIIDEQIGAELYDQLWPVTTAQADKIDQVLPDGIKTHRDKLADSIEAWLWVVIEGGEGFPYYPNWSGFDYPVEAVLVWENSD